MQHCTGEQREKTLAALPHPRASGAVNHAGSGPGGVRMKLERRVAAEHDTYQQAFMTEAFNLLFHKYGKPPID